jgi:hypothetical protein
MSADLSSEHHKHEIATYATLWAKHLAIHVVYQQVVMAGWPEQFDYPARLDDLPTVLLQAAQVDLGCVPLLAQALQLPLQPALLHHFCELYFPALLRTARAELLSFLADPEHHWLHPEAQDEACQGLEQLDHLLASLLTLPPACQAPPPGQSVALDRRKVVSAIADYQAMEQKRCWMVCLACGELFRTYEGLPLQSVHEQPRSLLRLACVDLFREWVANVKGLSPVERQATLSQVDQSGLSAAIANLPSAAQKKWEDYLHLFGSLAADHWAFTLNAMRTPSGGWERLPEPLVRWLPEEPTN